MKKITVTMDQNVAAELASLAKQNKRGVGNEAALIIESWFASNKKRSKSKVGDGDVAFDCGAVIEDRLEGLERQFVSWWHKASQDESEARERGELEVASAYNTFAAAYSTCGARVAEVRRAILKAKTPRESVPGRSSLMEPVLPVPNAISERWSDVLRVPDNGTR